LGKKGPTGVLNRKLQGEGVAWVGVVSGDTHHGSSLKGEGWVGGGEGHVR